MGHHHPASVSAWNGTVKPTLPQRQNAVLVAVTANPYHTAKELSKLAGGQERDNWSPRLSEMAKKGLVHRGPMRKDTISNKLATTWNPGPSPTGAPVLLPKLTGRGRMEMLLGCAPDLNDLDEDSLLAICQMLNMRMATAKKILTAMGKLDAAGDPVGEEAVAQ